MQCKWVENPISCFRDLALAADLVFFIVTQRTVTIVFTSLLSVTKIWVNLDMRKEIEKKKSLALVILYRNLIR